VKTITADSCRESKSQKVVIGRYIEQKVIGLIYHQQGADRDKQVAVNEKSKKAGNKSL
jgi:hypothetical protein